MAMKRCEADLHFYDMEKHESCPYCERLKGDERPVKGAAEKGAAADASSAATILMNSETKKPITVPGPMDDHPTAVHLSKEAAPAESLPDESAPTVFEPAPEPAARRRPSRTVSEPPVSPEPSQTGPTSAAEAPPAVEPTPTAGPATSTGPASNLEGMTVMVLGETKPFNPVVGWLVCTEGPEKGKDYHIKAGINEIGREADPEVDIVIQGDSLISRRYHAEIQYDPEDNVFYLIQKKNEAVKVNDVKVRRPTQLNPYDMIQLGETRLLFVPLCSEKFQWPNCR